MDKVEGALLVAEKALAEVAALKAEYKRLIDTEWEKIKAALVEQIEAKFKELPEPPKGDDGRGIKDLLIDRNGQLIATMDDGEMKVLGPVVGRDGKDGSPGPGLNDIDEWYEDGGRTLVRQFVIGEDFKLFRHQTENMIYRGVFKEGEAYMPGDVVTWGGSSWVAKVETTLKPDGPDGSWQLSVKRGRDGKDFKPKEG